ncbi:MAG TPA: cytochrome c biogenesis protein CcdA [Longimicrobiales bacterium]
MENSVSLAVAFLAGLLSFLSPCVLPLVPSYLGFITGMSLDELSGTRTRRAVLVPAAFFTLGFSLVFLIMGASATFLGQLLLRYQDWVARIGGVLIILFGLHLLGILRIGAFLRERRVQIQSRPMGYLGAGLAGIVFGAGWTPCIGPVLGTLLTYASARASLGSGMLLLAAYALGLALPFLAAAFATGAFLNTSRSIRRFIPVFEKISGAILLLAGILLVSGSFSTLSAYFARFTPNFLLDKL